MNQLTFAPASTTSSYRFSVDGQPSIDSCLSWLAQVESQATVILSHGGNLYDCECCIEVTIDKPFDGKETGAYWDYAYGLIHWGDDDRTYLVRLVVAASVFQSLKELAVKGQLPSVTVWVFPGHGLESAGPYGDLKWDTSLDRPIPVKQMQFNWVFS